MGEDTLSTLNWLVEAGAGEAIGDAPVNRLNAPAPMSIPARPAPPAARPAPAPRPAAAPLTGDAIGSAQSAAAGANTLEELKAALEAYDGCALKRTATNTVFADGTPA